MNVEKIADIISYIIIQGIFLMLFILGIKQWGFCWQLFFIFPIGSNILYFRVKSDIKKEDK